jgi:hypothetical protein
MSQTPDQTSLPDEPLDDQQDESSKFAAKRRRARRVLLVAFLIILIALGLYAVWPWILPAFIYEGPMVQMAGERKVTLVWYMTRPVEEGLSVRVGDGEQAFAVETNDRRCRAVITGLEPGHTYPCTIALNRHTLAQAKLRTNKPAGEPFTFAVLGDSGKGNQQQYRLAAQIAATDPDLVLHTGDLVYPCGERRDYRERFFAPYREIIRSVNFWPSLGNHDLYEPSYGQPYLEVFELPESGPPELPPERNYWFDYADARIAIVDSNLEEPALRDQVAPWLESVLAESSALWKFVVFHHPPYTGGHYPPDEKIQRTLVPVFESTGVDIVFNGHDHMYERTCAIRAGEPVDAGPTSMPGDSRGVVYIVTGAGGARLYEALPPEQRPAYIAALNNQIHSFTHVSIAGNELTLDQITLDGEVIDHWTLRKP